MNGERKAEAGFGGNGLGFGRVIARHAVGIGEDVARASGGLFDGGFAVTQFGADVIGSAAAEDGVCDGMGSDFEASMRELAEFVPGKEVKELVVEGGGQGRDRFDAVEVRLAGGVGEAFELFAEVGGEGATGSGIRREGG